MSNLQAVPQDNPEGLPLSGPEGTEVPRPSALKRFFKVITFSRLFARKRAPITDGEQQLSSTGNSTEPAVNEEMHEMQSLQNERTRSSELPRRGSVQESQQPQSVP